MTTKNEAANAAQSDIDGGAGFSIGRRALLKGAGGIMLLSAMPAGMRRALGEERFDLIVIGGGTAGIPAAIFAADRGARVLIVDKAQQLGGTLYLSTGQIAAANTVFQEKQGIDDSPDAHYEDIVRINGDTSDPVLTRLWTENGGTTINWLAEHGYTIEDGQPVRGSGHDFYSTARYLWGPRGGLSILNVMEPLLERHVDAGRVTVLTGAGAMDLVTDRQGAVTGVVTEDDRGKRADFRARNVLISSGGCAANPIMFENLHGVPLYSKIAYPFSQGAGLSLGLAAGGYVSGADRYVSSFGSIVADNRIPSSLAGSMSLSPAERAPWEVFVNARGERFVQEDHPSVGHRERALDQQPGHRFWAIFDQQILEQAPELMPSWSRERFLEAFDEHPMFSRAPSLTELGVVAGIDPAALDRNVADYNSALSKSRPDRFDRSHRPLPILRPPFYAIRSQGWTVKSFAGLAVNRNLEVVTADERPVGNLYAAGEVLGAATSGRAYVNGASVTPALTFGRLLGQRIMRF